MSGGTFNIGSQQAGAIFVAGRDQTVHHGEGTMSVDALAAVTQLRDVVQAAPLAPADKRDALQALGEADEELRKQAPEKSLIARNLTRVADVLDRAGGLAAATNALQALAKWLGPVGIGLLGMVL